MKLLQSQNNWKTLIDILEFRAAQNPEKTIYNLLTDNEIVETLTYGELLEKSKTIAGQLQQNCQIGDRILLLYPQNLSYITAFFGCLLAGMIAVPAYPPRNNRNFGRIETIVADSQASAALINTTVENRIKRATAGNDNLLRLKLINTDSIDENAGELIQTSISAASTAFLQYTSGSTSEPKGVIVSHENLLVNQQMIRDLFKQSEDSVILGWLPLYHDMGLIGNVLQPLFVNAECFLMTPAEFVQNPVSWLKAISTYRATTSGGPNFAYELCLKRVKEEEILRLDLNCWKVAFNGAEPISAATLERFAKTFEKTGFRKSSFFPCYGLAEATLLVSATDSEQNFIQKFDAGLLEKHIVSEAKDENAKLLVNCGEIAEGITVEIVNPETCIRSNEHEIGEIWLSGSSVANGYWNNPDETAKTFQARLHNEDGETFLRTGDLGFIKNSNLFITGRIKDLIILNGRNLYPQDIEKSIENCHPALRKDGCIAFAAEAEKGEKLIIVQEIEPRSAYVSEQVFAEIQKILANEYEISAGQIVLIKAGTLPKTSSGKKRRKTCRNEFLTDKLEIADKFAAEDNFQTDLIENDDSLESAADEFEVFRSKLKRSVSEALKIHPQNIKENISLLSYGLDSLTALELAHTIKKQFKIDFSVSDLIEEDSFETLCRFLWELKPAKEQISEQRIDIDVPETELSRGQKALWFLQQLAPENTAYNLNFLAKITNENFEPSKLKEAFEKICVENDILRSTFEVKNGQPVRKINQSPNFEWSENTYPENSTEEVKRLINEEFQRPFDLVNEPLLRLGIWRIGESETLFSLSLHHIIADFWSLSLIIKRLGELYSLTGVSIGNEKTEASRFREFVIVEEKYLSTSESEANKSFWRNQLSGELPHLDFPFDFQRPSIQTFEGKTLRFELDQATVKKLKDLSVKQRTTLFVSLLTAYKIFLYRYTNQSDLIVGTPTSGRENPAYKNTLGYLVNPVAVRSFADGEASFEKYLENVRKTFKEISKNQKYPFIKVVEDNLQDQDASRSPIFQTMFILQQSPIKDLPGLAAWAQGDSAVKLDLGELKLESEEIEQTFSQFDLTLMIAENGEKLSAAFQYNKNLLSPQTVERMGENFNKLLKSIVENPLRAISELEIVADDEYKKIVFEWNNTAQDYDQKASIHGLFENQAAQTPDKIAVSFQRNFLTYKYLNEQSNRFANYLKLRGVENGDRIAVCLNRSERLIVVLMGILKAGAAYVPMDPNYPQNRLKLMLEDSESAFVVTENELLSILPFDAEKVIDFDVIKSELDQMSSDIRPIIFDPKNLAYIIYTSGSTGTPKGVAIEHRSVCALINWAKNTFSEEELGKVLASTSICFDLSVFEIFSTLACGGEVCLAENALSLLSADDFSDITLINTVPSAMTELCRNNKLPGKVQTVNLAGEPLLNHLVEKVYKNEQVKRVFNLYGPSEDTTYSTFALMPGGKGVNSLIGKPLTNSQVYLLNEKMLPVPIGVTGEIYLGGDGVTRGYFNKPLQTSERFVPDDLSGKFGGRLYKTSDLARFTENGDLIFLGRTDHQVKIRGFRIELGEIESRIGQHPAIKENVVIAHTNKNNEKLIVCHLVSEPHKKIAKIELITYLRENLPEYMIPAEFIFLASLPLTPNGKIDRKKLPEPTETESESVNEFTAPRTSLEEVVAGQMKETLGIRKIGVDTNFFYSGGHSLLAAQLIIRLKQIFQIEIPLRAVFEKPTPAALSKLIADMLASGEKTEFDRIGKIPEKRPFKLSPSQRKLWFIDQINPRSSVYNVPAALSLKGKPDIEALRNAFEVIHARHEILQSGILSIDGEPFQITDKSRKIDWHYEDFRNSSADLGFHLVAEAREGFDLRSENLYRIRLWQTADDEYVLLVVMHHIITDGWSLGILIRELKKEYEKQLDKTISHKETPSQKELQYSDYAEWQIEGIANGKLSRQLQYWQKKLDGIKGNIELPTDFERPAKPAYKGAKIPINIDAQTVRELKKLGQSKGYTLFMLLLAAVNILLRRFSEETDVCIGVPVANRFHPDTEKIIGFFANSLVIRATLENRETVEALIQKVKENTIEAFTNQELPFDLLVENLPLPRQINRNPVFQVALAFQNNFQTELNLPEIECEFIEIDTGTSKFDLTFDLRETDRGLEGHLEYSTEIFGEKTAEELEKRFLIIVESLPENLNSSIADFPLLSETDVNELKSLVNCRQMKTSMEISIPEVFSKIVRNYPDKDALVWDDERLSYRELDERSNLIADFLNNSNTGDGGNVAVRMSRTPELIVSILGILKAGLGYVPLEPSFPVERVNYILRDTAAKIVLTSKEFDNGFAYANEVEVVEVENLLAENHRILPNIGEPHIKPQTTAYIMYTSGSTGEPKGVCVTHRNILRLVKSQNYAKLDKNQVILQLAPISFDASTFEIWGALLNGASLALMPDGFTNAEAVGNALKKYQITTLWLTAGLFHLMVDENLDDLALVKQLLAGGDVLSTSHVNRFLNKTNGSSTFINGYGPTENTTFTACFPTETPYNRRSLPIGKSINQSEVYIVDENLQLVPRGVIGELVTGGAGVSNGYLNKPKLTAQTFIPDPFSGKTGSRLYRTGDLARISSDGFIEFIGRKDEQVKINGYRIEPGEIEAVLNLHDSVKRAVITVDKNAFGDKTLAAFIIAEKESQVEISGIRNYLTGKLPAFMIPKRIGFVNEFPLTTNGKIDKKQLVLNEAGQNHREINLPQTKTEIRLAEIWKNLLAKNEIGLDDDFFELGGHSLLATRLAAAIKRDFSCDISIVRVFEIPTIRALAKEISENENLPRIITRNHPIKPLGRSRKNIKTLLKELDETVQNKTENDRQN
ncbi:MAG: amino acid adenylation domain-containing protein [Pyrinomonadaceae bacterium]|nr:amino acid adenylation domain-containing protein [Pyrinomonadaceae bacterium]